MLESQYQSSMTIASKRINAGQENVCVESVGYLLEELRNPDVLAAFKKVNPATSPGSSSKSHRQQLPVVADDASRSSFGSRVPVLETGNMQALREKASPSA